ncbi:MAG: lipoyl synthase [Deltaproteobacteria bacterium]|nr:lipoyl synthase [Deltaproteobacteria bacterium]
MRYKKTQVASEWRKGESPKSSKTRHPEWLKVRMPQGDEYHRLKTLVREHGLHTVCESASCPNIGECWNYGTLTVMILGNVCTRSCRFCDVPTGRPGALNTHEPEEVATMLSKLNLKYTVITSVDRDDLPDEGASHWAATITKTRELCPGMKIESLIPDFHGRPDLLTIICQAAPDVLAHNLETVASLQTRIRPQSRYDWSLAALDFTRKEFGMMTKSGLMLGLGEKQEEVIQAMEDLRKVDCQILTLGQYLRPSWQHHPVIDYISPALFKEYQEIGEKMGFAHVESGPLVRSSYRADRQAAGLFPIDAVCGKP